MDGKGDEVWVRNFSYGKGDGGMDPEGDDVWMWKRMLSQGGRG